MPVTAFYDRRQQTSPIEDLERRFKERRNGQNGYFQERRRPASQVRRYGRASLSIPLRFDVDGKKVTGSTRDIGPEGMLLVTDSPLRDGTPLSLKFSFGKNVAYMNLAGQVIYCLSSENGESRNYGIGIKFSGIREWEQRILQSAIQELKQSEVVQENSLLTIAISKDSLALEAAGISAENTSKLYSNALHKIEGAKDETAHQEKEGDRSRLRSFMASRRKRKFTPHPDWVIDLSKFTEPYRKAILESRIIREASAGTLSLRQMRAWMTQLYPFIETFPKYIALNIAKTQDSFSRGILIENVRVEKKHAEQWVYMAEGFGIPENELVDFRPLPEVDALTHWLWSINTQGTLAEAVAANTYAIEGVTQGIAESTVKGFPKYDGIEGVSLDKKMYWWMEAHAKYDDEHPLEALEIIKIYATTKELQEKVKYATTRSLEYLLMALEACYVSFRP